MSTLRSSALRALLIADPVEKSAYVRAFDLDVLVGKVALVEQHATSELTDEVAAHVEANVVDVAEVPHIVDGVDLRDLQLPGRLDRPPLVHPKEVSNRSVATLEGHQALIHSLCHIELNAVNLALDICWRFSNMPTSFYVNWWHVAKEEALHFSMLREHLVELGKGYGDFPAHNGLWEMAEKTKDDLMARLVMVPMLLEARGLDVSPPIRAKLWTIGDRKGAEILDIILSDEVGHVALGLKWYRWLCQKSGLDEKTEVSRLREKYAAPKQRGPINVEARLAAGFSQEELEALRS